MDLIERLRALARHEHSDVSIAEEAADALEAAREAMNAGQTETISLRDAMAMSVRLPDDYSARWAEVLIGEQQPNAVEPVGVHIEWWMRVEAAYRYRMADAMLKERENKS